MDHSFKPVLCKQVKRQYALTLFCDIHNGYLRKGKFLTCSPPPSKISLPHNDLLLFPHPLLRQSWGPMSLAHICMLSLFLFVLFFFFFFYSVLLFVRLLFFLEEYKKVKGSCFFFFLWSNKTWMELQWVGKRHVSSLRALVSPMYP